MRTTPASFTSPEVRSEAFPGLRVFESRARRYSPKAALIRADFCIAHRIDLAVRHPNDR